MKPTDCNFKYLRLVLNGNRILNLFLPKIQTNWEPHDKIILMDMVVDLVIVDDLLINRPCKRSALHLLLHQLDNILIFHDMVFAHFLWVVFHRCAPH